MSSSLEDSDEKQTPPPFEFKQQEVPLPPPSYINNKDRKIELSNWFEEKFKMLKSLSDIPPNSKLVDRGAVFELFDSTLLGWLNRTFLTRDSGEVHSAKIEEVFKEIDLRIDELNLENNSDYNINILYYSRLLELLETTKRGLTNLSLHKDYNSFRSATSTNLKHVIEFKIPLLVDRVQEQIKFRQQQRN